MINLDPLIALVGSYFLFTFIISIYLRIKKIKDNKKSKNLKNIQELEKKTLTITFKYF